MRVIPIARTEFWPNDVQQFGYQPHYPIDGFDADQLAEFAGRNCYQSWDRPNPKTATNEGYLKNILNQGHYSVLEHASISFYVDGVSRALLTELERHRFLSFSVISQRYVKMEQEDVVLPPAMHGNEEVRQLFVGSMDEAFYAYDLIVKDLTDKGLPKKKALEAARSVLPNATEVKMVVTGNVRAWRDVIGKRYHQAADAEIREFATEVLKHLREYAPNSVQDIPETPYG